MPDLLWHKVCKAKAAGLNFVMDLELNTTLSWHQLLKNLYKRKVLL